jgi:hypothetical protein
MDLPPTIANLHVIPEEMIIFCANQFASDEENTFRNFLLIAAEFRSAGLTPIYLCTEHMKDLYITTQEKLQKKFH